MSDYFFDSSALVKRYVAEAGDWYALSLTDPTAGHSILVAEITLVEIAAALAAKQRAPLGISIVVRDRAVARFLQECAQRFAILPVDRRTIDIGVQLTQRHRLRGYDAVQLATALVANTDLISRGRPPLLLVSGDDELLAAARAEGLPTDNPLHHAQPPAAP